MKCHICSSEIELNSKICASCGTPVDVNTGASVWSISGTDSEATPELPKVEFIDAVKLGFKNYFKFSGRSRRSEYWWFFLFGQLISFIGNIPFAGWVIGIIGGLALIIPSISITTRRLHDIGESGWWQVVFFFCFLGGWIALIVSMVLGFSKLEDKATGLAVLFFLAGSVASVAIIGLIIIWVIWFVRKGDEGWNRYGPDPRRHIT